MLSKKYREIDKSNMFEIIYRFPEQIREAMEIGERVKIKGDYSKVRKIVFAGMGGSAISGDILSLFLWKVASQSLAVTRNYYLPNWVGEDTLVFCFSYSGNTEETLSTLEDATRRGAVVAGISSDGTLMERLEEVGADFIKIPGGFPPRASLGYLTIPLFYFLNRANLISDFFSTDLEQTAASLEQYCKLFARDFDGNIAFKIASEIYDSIPLIYGEADGTAVVALRWRTQLEENGKILAFHHSIPEMNHNEIVGWENNPELLKRLVVIWLRDREIHPQTAKRVAFTKEIIRDIAKNQIEVQSEGRSFFERIFYLIYLGDWVSYWVALLHGVDPSPVDKIDELKRALARD